VSGASAGIAVRAALGPHGFAWLLEGQLAGTPRPGFVLDAECDLQDLQQAGITRLISLTEFPVDAAQAAAHGIRCACSPVRDMGAPSLPQARRLCLDIDAYRAAGEVVAVHCRAGLGRTATVLAAYWIWLEGGRVGADKALARVRSMQPAMVQSREQVDFLRRFADDVGLRAVTGTGSRPSHLENTSPCNKPSKPSLPPNT